MIWQFIGDPGEKGEKGNQGRSGMGDPGPPGMPGKKRNLMYTLDKLFWYSVTVSLHYMQTATVTFREKALHPTLVSQEKMAQ